MALADEVTTRLPSQVLVELTNPNTPSATTADATVLAAAAADAQADFQIFAGVEYDNSDVRHVRVGVEGTVYHLHKYKLPPGHPALNSMTQQYNENLQALARVTGRNRIMPKTTSVLVPSDEQSHSGQTVRPSFDRDRFGALEPQPPLHFGNVRQIARQSDD